MAKHIIPQSQFQALLNNTKSFSKIKVNDIVIVRENGKIYLVSPKNNVITYDFCIDLNKQLNALTQMDLNNNTFCQDCIEIKNCHSCNNCINCFNCTGLDYETGLTNITIERFYK